MALVTVSEGDLDRQFMSEEDIIDRILNGRIWAWGSGGSGQRGDGTTTSSVPYPVRVADTFNASKVAAGLDTTYYAFNPAGGAYATGINTYGQLGTNTTTTTSNFSSVSGLSRLTKIAAGYLNAYFLDDTGTIWSTGFGNYIGDGSSGVDRSSPVSVVGGIKWKDIASSGVTTLAIDTSNYLWAWGHNDNYRFGNGATGYGTLYLSPITAALGIGGWKQVSSSSSHTLGLKQDGVLWAWGFNNQGQLGDSSLVNKSSPVTVVGNYRWKHCSAGYQFSVAIRDDGTMWSWGNNSYRQLGNGTPDTPYVSPTSVIGGATNWIKASAGYQFVVAIKTDGTLWTWGRNQFGQLGLNDYTNRSSPVQVSASGTNNLTWLDVSAGDTHIVALSDFGAY